MRGCTSALARFRFRACTTRAGRRTVEQAEEEERFLVLSKQKEVDSFPWTIGLRFTRLSRRGAAGSAREEYAGAGGLAPSSGTVGEYSSHPRIRLRFLHL